MLAAASAGNQFSPNTYIDNKMLMGVRLKKQIGIPLSSERRKTAGTLILLGFV